MHSYCLLDVNPLVGKGSMNIFISRGEVGVPKVIAGFWERDAGVVVLNPITICERALISASKKAFLLLCVRKCTSLGNDLGSLNNSFRVPVLV